MSAQHQRIVQLVIFGVGTVGKALLKALSEKRDVFLNRFKLQLDVAIVSDSSGWVGGSPTVQQEDLSLILQAKQDGKKLKDSFKQCQSSDTIVEAVDSLISQSAGSKVRVVVVDCTATAGLAQSFAKWVEAGACAAFANKKPVTIDQDVFNRLMDPEHAHRVGLESTVGAGTPIVATARGLMRSGDSIKRIVGTFSGTLGYLCSQLEAKVPYSEVVQTAFKAGYTEPDPRDDLSGTDVARKALILARTTGATLELEDVKVESLYPVKLAGLPVPEFLDSLTQLDDEFTERRAKAEANGCVLRYVAEVKGSECSVGLQAVPKKSPLGQLSGTDNMCNFHTDIYDQSPLVIQGSGAGPDVTAAGVLSDIVQITS